MARLGIVTGTRIEASNLAMRTAHERRIVVCSGADADQARAVARQMIAEGCTALASVGTAGGLDPDLAPGEVVIGDTVFTPAGARIAGDERWRQALATLLASGGLPFHIATIAGCDAPVAEPAAKRRLFVASGAVCCDMESAAVAEVATAARVRFIVVRTIADPATRALPGAAMASVARDGGIRYGALLCALLRKPSDVAAMAGLAMASRKALRSLRRVAALGGPVLGLPLA